MIFSPNEADSIERDKNLILWWRKCSQQIFIRSLELKWKSNGGPGIRFMESTSKVPPAASFFMIRPGHFERVKHSFSPQCFLEYQSRKNKKRELEEWEIGGEKSEKIYMLCCFLWGTYACNHLKGSDSKPFFFFLPLSSISLIYLTIRTFWGCCVIYWLAEHTLRKRERHTLDSEDRQMCRYR